MEAFFDCWVALKQLPKSQWRSSYAHSVVFSFLVISIVILIPHSVDQLFAFGKSKNEGEGGHLMGPHSGGLMLAKGNTFVPCSFFFLFSRFGLKILKRLGKFRIFDLYVCSKR